MDTKPIIDSESNVEVELQPEELEESGQPEQSALTTIGDYVNPLTITSTIQDQMSQVQLPSINSFTDMFSPTGNVESEDMSFQEVPDAVQEEQGESVQPNIEQEEQEEQPEEKDDILNIELFQEGDSLQLISKNMDNNYHNKIMDFLYEDKGTLYLVDDDDLFELEIKDNKIVTNDNQIYNIIKTKDIEYAQENAFIVNELNLSIIESGVEIQERLLSEWEREWTESEYITSIIENMKSQYKNKSYYELDFSSKNLLELVNDTKLYSHTLLPHEAFNEDDNTHLIQKIYNNQFSNSFIKPIIIDKKKIITNKTDIVSNDVYIENQKLDIKILESLQYRNYHPQADHYRSSVDSYEKEIMVGNKKTLLLNDDGELDEEDEPVSYINPFKTYINENSDTYSLEYHLLDTGLEYNTKVYRYHYPRYSLVIDDNDQVALDFKDIESRYADGHYYRYYDQLDKRRITDTYGKLKATQICHGIKAETLFSDSIDERGRANIKKHKDSAFNKSISKLPKNHIYIEGEKILICGFVLHNTNIQSPTFVNPDQYIDETGLLKINYSSNDNGYSLLDYVHQHKKNINNPYMHIYDINHNKKIYKQSLQKKPSFYDINNFIYFNTHKHKHLHKIIINDEIYDLTINKKGYLIIHNITTDTQEEPKDVNDPTIPVYIINALLTHKLIVKEKDVYEIVFKNIHTSQYLETIKQIVPTISDVLTYEYHNKVFLETNSIKDINKVLSKYDLTYNTLPKKHRQNIKHLIRDNIKQYKRDVIIRSRTLQKHKKNKMIIEKIYNEIDIEISKLIKQRYYYKEFTKLNITKEDYTGTKPELEELEQKEEETETDFQKRSKMVQINYETTVKRWNIFNEEYIQTYHNQHTLNVLFDTIKSRIKAKCNVYILNESFVSLDELEMFLDYISDHKYDKTKNNDRLYIISIIVDILYSRFDTIYYKNLFFDDISTTSYENFCKLQKSGQTTLYCSEQSLQFLKEYYKYNHLHIYDSYQQNNSTYLSKNNLQIIDMIYKCKQNKNYELLLDIYKNIQIERELVNIEKSYNRIVTNTESSISLEELLEQNKREFMVMRDSFNDQLKEYTYYDVACFGFKIVKVYKKKYDLLSDNMAEKIYYDEIFDTTERDIDIIQSYIHKAGIELDDINRPDERNNLSKEFKHYYIFSPEYEIENLINNAIENIKNMDISPKKNGSGPHQGKIMINKISDEKDRILWNGKYFSLDMDGTMILEGSDNSFNINELSKEINTQITTAEDDVIEINRSKLFAYLDMLNIIHVHKKQVKRCIVDNEYAILKNGASRHLYKRKNNKWISLDKDAIDKEKTSLLDKYKFKHLVSLEFDDFLLLNKNTINELEANPAINISEDTPSSLQQVQESIQQENTPVENDTTPELSGDVSIQTVLQSVPEEKDDNEVDDIDVEEGLEEGKEGEEELETEPEQPVEESVNVVKEGSETDTMTGGDIYKDDLTDLFGISESVVNKMEGGADTEEKDATCMMDKPLVEETFNGFNSCINTDFLPMDVQNLFTYPNETDSDMPFLNITVPKRIIKWIFTINKKFNLIKEMDHVIVDKQTLIDELQTQSVYINSQLQILQKMSEEQKIHDEIEITETISKKIKKNKIPTYIQEEFYSIFLIQDVDICLSTLKDFIEKYGIYNKPENDIEIDEEYEVKTIDPERDPSTAKFVYWDPYFFPDVNEKMCCKHYIDLTSMAWLDNTSRTNVIEEVVRTYAQKDHVEGGHVICKHCGENINFIKYSDQEGFGAEDKPIIFREKIEDDDYDDLVLSSDYSSQFFSKKIVMFFMKSLNIKLSEKDMSFIEMNSFKIFKLYEKNQKDVYRKFLHTLIHTKKIINKKAYEHCKSFYNSLIKKNPQLTEFIITHNIQKQKKQKKQYLNLFMSKYYKKINKQKFTESTEVKQFLKFSDAILKQTEKYNTTLQIYTTMIYFIFIVLYSNNHYKIISSGDARYTGQRFIIYDTESSLKDKCLELSLDEKKTAGKKQVWRHFIHDEDLFESIYNMIYKLPDIQDIKQERLEYNALQEQKTKTIQQTLNWNTFRPKLIPDYNYTNTTSMDDLQTLVTQLQGTTSNIKKYKLLSHISEETRKLSLEHISKINNFIILHKQIKHLNFVSYQSSCCDFNIQDSYQKTLSKELTDRTKDITILYDNIKQSDTDYYLLHGFKGVNDVQKGRYLLDYLNMKQTLHNEYIVRREKETYSVSDKDKEYKQYLEEKIYKINHYAVMEQIFPDDTFKDSKRMFIDVIEPDYYLLSEVDDDSENVEEELKTLLRKKYDSIISSFHITSSQYDASLSDPSNPLTSFNKIINQKYNIIVNYDGQTKKDLVSNMYIYEINNKIENYIEEKTIDELKIVADNLENYLEKKIKTKLIVNRNKSQQNKTYVDKRYKKNHTNTQLSIVKDISETFYSVDTDNELFSDNQLFTTLYTLYNDTRDPIDDDWEDILGEYNAEINNIIINIVEIYDSFMLSDTMVPTIIRKLKKIYTDYGHLIEILGDNDDLIKEKIDLIETDLIVQGYIKNSTKYNNELEYRKRNITTNLESDRIQLYKEAIKYILNVYNKLNYFKEEKVKNDIHIQKEEELIRDMFMEQVDLNVQSEFIQHILEIKDGDKKGLIYKLLDKIAPKRDIHTINNDTHIKSLYNVDTTLVLIKYIFVRILYAFMEIGTYFSGIQKTHCETLKKVILSNISNIHIQLKNADKIIEDELIAYQKTQNDTRKKKFENMVKNNRENASIYLISRTINMGDIFRKRNEANEALYNVNEEGGVAAFLSQAVEGQQVETPQDMEEYAQNQADMDAAQEFGMGNVHGEDDIYED